MIRSLRRRHLFTVATLSIVLPLALALSLRSRQPEPLNDDLSQLLAEIRTAPADAPGETAAWPGLGSTLRIGGGAGEPRVVELSPPPRLRRPDVLLYWSATRPPDRGGLPERALLLGRLDHEAGGRYELPEGVGGGGFFILYSLGHGEIVSVAESPAEPLAPSGGGGG